MSQSNQIVSHFLSHRNVTNELAEKISKDHYGYKPAETSMSAEELVKHILTSFHLFANVIKEGNASPFQNKQEETETDLNVLARTYTEKTVAILEQLTEERLDREIDLTATFGRKSQATHCFSLQWSMKFTIKATCSFMCGKWAIQSFLSISDACKGNEKKDTCLGYLFCASSSLRISSRHSL